jgi:hypothetical protein
MGGIGRVESIQRQLQQIVSKSSGVELAELTLSSLASNDTVSLKRDKHKSAPCKMAAACGSSVNWSTAICSVYEAIC